MKLPANRHNRAAWNMKGSDFIQLHALYDTVAADVIEPST
jgi:DNA-binding ferritin-like protein